jgi:hypothetical protein
VIDRTEIKLKIGGQIRDNRFCGSRSSRYATLFEKEDAITGFEEIGGTN